MLVLCRKLIHLSLLWNYCAARWHFGLLWNRQGSDRKFAPWKFLKIGKWFFLKSGNIVKFTPAEILSLFLHTTSTHLTGGWIIFFDSILFWRILSFFPTKEEGKARERKRKEKSRSASPSGLKWTFEITFIQLSSIYDVSLLVLVSPSHARS